VNAYDAIPYPGRPYPQTHPDRLGAVATLAGMAPAPVERCRVLEIACGDASNLIPMAHGLPASEFVGIDLAAGPIERGKDFARALGLKNLELHALDLADFPAHAGRFDYIVAHGLYSWIPAAARDRLLALVARHLAPRGVAYVSYNTYPGCYVRRAAWEMLRFHTARLADPDTQIAEARRFARLLATGRAAHDEASAPFRAELESLAERDPAYLFHDDLAATNEPVYFHDFVEHAQRYGLQFLGEAEVAATGCGGLSPGARHVLDQLDLLTREQYRDFMVGRRFRQSLLCHEDVALDRTSAAGRITPLFLTTRGCVAGAPEEPDALALPTAGDGQTVREAQSLVETLVETLDEAAPRRLTFGELAGLVGADDGRPNERVADFFRHVVLAAARAGFVLLHTATPALTIEPGDRPLASPIARHQVGTGRIVTTLSHDSVNIDDETVRRLLPLLDGTRTRSALVAALGTALDGSSDAARAAKLDEHLLYLARLALFVAPGLT
jgi:SAM-dependent methyltransferase